MSRADVLSHGRLPDPPDNGVDAVLVVLFIWSVAVTGMTVMSSHRANTIV